MCVEEKEGEGGRLVLRCERAVAEDSVDNEEEPFEVIYRMNIKPQEGRTIFFSRHGESEYNVQERIGGDPDLTVRGHRYAKALGQYINALDLPSIHIWTSTLRRTIQTAAHISGPRSRTPLLDEIKSGFLDSFTYGEIEERFPEEWEARERDKLKYRYPGGESYVDCSRRILPVLMELEHRGEESSVVVVAHQAVLRCVFGYLLRRPMEDVPFIKIPQHAIMQVTYEQGENVVDFIRMPIDHVEQGVTVASQDQPKTTKTTTESSKEPAVSGSVKKKTKSPPPLSPVQADPTFRLF